MTLEEAICAANSGDVAAMCLLGKYYLDQKQMSDAMEWFYLAVQHGDIDSAKLGSRLSGALAVTCEQMEDWENAYKYWGQNRECQPLVMQARETTDNDCVRLLQAMNHALYRQAISCSHLGKMDLALKYLEEAAKDSEYVSGDKDAKELLKKIGGEHHAVQ